MKCGDGGEGGGGAALGGPYGHALRAPPKLWDAHVSVADAGAGPVARLDAGAGHAGADAGAGP
eukprot:scaffold9637_cov39-Isochrysis_galbana.AAC.1